MYMPVLLYSEKNAVMNHADEIVSFGHKALIVTGRISSRINGSLDDVISALEKNNCEYAVFDKIEENPSVQNVMDAVYMGKEENADYVIGIGGGSPLDAAKAVAFMLSHPNEDASLLYRKSDDTSLPLVLIPTTCGTGSEVTQVSVLTVPELRTKKSISHKVFADLALIDGKYLKTASLSVLQSTALDALTHMIESFINVKSDYFSRMFVESGLALWRKNIDLLSGGNASDDSYFEMMNASAMAGMAIAQTGTGIPHGLSYSLTYKMHIPHGKAVGYFTAGYLNESPDNLRKYILDRIGFSSVRDFADWYNDLFGKIEVQDSVLTEAVSELWENQPKIRTAPFSVDMDALYRIAFFNK